MRDVPAPFVSVIIPVFNDFERLQTCLCALESQTYPKGSYEVVVVDNGSDEDVEHFVGRFGQVRVAREERPGSYAARNRGLSLAGGEVIAFTDADCIPAPDWIEKGVAKLLGVPDRGMVVGKISLFFKDPCQPTAVELFESVTAFSQKRYVEELGFGATANVFALKSVIEDVGPFDDRLRSLGDYEWGRRVSAAGYGQVYADDVCVRHPARRSFGQLYKRVIRKAGGLHELRRRDKARQRASYFLGFEKEFFLALVPPVRFARRILSDGRLNGTTDRLKVVFVMVFARYLEAWERLRLRLGGEPHRV